MNANYSIQLTEGDYTATYTIYYNSVSASNIATLLTSNLPADGLSLTTMLSGVNISVPGTANLIIVVGDGYCANSIEFQIVPIQTPVPPPDLCLSFIGDGILYSWQFTPNSTQNNKTKWESIQNGTTYTMYWNPFVVPNVWQVEVETKLVFISTNTTDIPDSSWTVQGSGSYGPITNLNVIQGTCPDIEPITTKSRAENNLCSDGTCTGIITVLTTLGGTPPYQYSLDNSAPTSSTIFSNVCPGQHDLETIDSNGLTNTTQITIQQGQIPTTYSLDINYSNVNVLSSVDTDIKKVEWAITTNPALPVGASVLFELILDSTQTISAPGTGVITIDEKTYLNNVLQTPLTNENTSTSNRTDGCSAFQKSKKTQASSYYITLTSSSVLTGTTVSTLNIPTNSGSQSNGCVTKLEQSLTITINNFKFLGTCSNTNTPRPNTILDNQLLYAATPISLLANWYNMPERPFYAIGTVKQNGCTDEAQDIIFTLSSLKINNLERLSTPSTYTLTNNNLNVVPANNNEASGCTIGSMVGWTYTNIVTYLNSIFTQLGLTSYKAQVSYIGINVGIDTDAGFYILYPPTDTFEIIIQSNSPTSEKLKYTNNNLYYYNSITQTYISPAKYYRYSLNRTPILGGQVIE